MATLTVTGNEITDAIRTASPPLSGDGRAADSSFGFWKPATNLITNGGLETVVTGWTAVLGASVVRQTNFGKFGNCSAYVTLSATQYSGVNTPSAAVSAATVYSGQVWVYRAEAVKQITVAVRGLVSAVDTQIVAPVATQLVVGWQQVKIANWTTPASTTTAYLQVVVADASGATGVALNADGAQIETGAFCTSYIDTTAGTAARAAAFVSAPTANMFTDAQGWFAACVRFDTGPTGTNQDIVSYDNGVNNIYVYNDGTNMAVLHSRNGVGGTTITVPYVPAAGNVATVMCYWTGTGGSGNGVIGLSVNGAAFVTQNRPAAGGAYPTTFNIGANGTGAIPLNGEVFWVAAGRGTVTAADALLAAQYGQPDPTFTAFQFFNGGFAYPSFVWFAVDVNYNLGGFDNGFKLQCVQSYIDNPPNLRLYNNMNDDVYQAFIGRHYNLGSEVESAQTSTVFSPQMGLAGQAYWIGSRYPGGTVPPVSPMMFDYVSGTHAGGYTAYLRQDFSNVNRTPPFVPLSIFDFTWLGDCDYMDKGAVVGYGYANTCVTSLSAAIAASTNSDVKTLFRSILGALFTYPVMVVPVGDFAHGSGVPLGAGGSGYSSVTPPTFVMSGGTGGGATGHGTVPASGPQAGQVTAWVVDTPGSYTVAPTGITITHNGGVGATGGTPVTSIIQFFGALDLNLLVSASTPAYPKDAIYVANSEPYVRACVQGSASTWYGFASIDASAALTNGVTPLTLNGAIAARTATWNVFMTYLQQTMDQKVGSNGSTPNAASTTPYMPRPLYGMGSVLMKGFNLAVESSQPTIGSNLVLDYAFSGIAHNY